MSQIDTSEGTQILSRPGGESGRKRKTQTGCVQESAGVSPWVEVSPTENMVITHNLVQVLVLSGSNGNVASWRTYCFVYVFGVWIIEDMQAYPKLNSVAVSGRTRNAYWQSLFLCSSSGGGLPTAYTIHPAASRIQNRCSEAENTRSALLLDSQIVLTMGCTALRCRGCVMEDTASQVVGCML